jgi:hypothetical protein
MYHKLTNQQLFYKIKQTRQGVGETGESNELHMLDPSSSPHENIANFDPSNFIGLLPRLK